VSAVSLGITSQDRLLHIGNGVNLERFDPEKLRERRKPVREAFGISGDQPLVCIIGRLVREKGYFELIEAFRTVVREVPGVKLLVIGGALESDHDDAESEIRGRVKEYGLEDVVRFLSFRGDVEEILCASDVFVLPSHREGMPRSILEAMAMGLPVVATQVRGAREEVQDGINGLLVDVGDHEGLAAALVTLLKNPDERIRMGRRGRQIAVEQFDERTVIAKQVKVIRRLLSEKGLF
jgi:glycosyltransferase involved in cell wall biosynthesis